MVDHIQLTLYSVPGGTVMVDRPTKSLASFPGPARSSLAVRNLRRGPGLVHHVMSASDEHAGPGNEATKSLGRRLMADLV